MSQQLVVPPPMKRVRLLTEVSPAGAAAAANTISTGAGAGGALASPLVEPVAYAMPLDPATPLGLGAAAGLDAEAAAAGATVMPVPMPGLFVPAGDGTAWAAVSPLACPTPGTPQWPQPVRLPQTCLPTWVQPAPPPQLVPQPVASGSSGSSPAVSPRGQAASVHASPRAGLKDGRASGLAPEQKVEAILRRFPHSFAQELKVGRWLVAVERPCFSFLLWYRLVASAAAPTRCGRPDVHWCTRRPGGAQPPPLPAKHCGADAPHAERSTMVVGDACPLRPPPPPPRPCPVQIDVRMARPEALFQWLCASILMSARIKSNAGGAAGLGQPRSAAGGEAECGAERRREGRGQGPAAEVPLCQGCGHWQGSQRCSRTAACPPLPAPALCSPGCLPSAGAGGAHNASSGAGGGAGAGQGRAGRRRLRPLRRGAALPACLPTCWSSLMPAPQTSLRLEARDSFAGQPEQGLGHAAAPAAGRLIALCSRV